MHVLVVDDDATNRLVLKAMLEKDGHSVLLAENGEQGVDLFDVTNTDMVLMDVMMPIMDGYEATRIIKEKSGNVFIPVIFITAVTDETALSDCIDCGGDDFLTKPFIRTILRAKINALERIRALYVTILEQKSELEEHNHRVNIEHHLAEKVYDNIVYQNKQDSSLIKSVHRPAETFSGDVMFFASTPSGGMNIFMGDVTGHGLGAAICAMPVSEIFYGMSEKGFSVQDIVTEINQRLYKLLPTEMFLAAAFVQIAPECRALYVWNGGLPDIIINGGDQGLYSIPAKHIPLGIVSANQFSSEIEMHELEAGNKIIMYTDGLIEVTSPDGKMFSQERLEKLIRGHDCSENTVEYVCEDLNSYIQGDTFDDDITMLEFLCDPVLLAEAKADASKVQRLPSQSWSVEFELSTGLLRTTDPLPLMIQYIIDIQGLYAYRTELFTILSELYNNALDHGILKLDTSMKNHENGFIQFYQERKKRLSSIKEGLIKITISNKREDEGGCLSLTIQDSGDGFRIDKSAKSLESNLGRGGRGIPLVKSLCEELSYKGKGNIVQAKYTWH